MGIPLVVIVALAVVLYNATLVDRRPPSVAGVTLSAPTDDPRVGQTLTAIDVHFSEPVKTGTVERRFSIAPAVAGTFRWDGETTLIFTPSARLPPATLFTVAIAAGYEDLAGNAAAVPASETFSTIGPPVVDTAEPTGPSVPVTSTVVLTFDRLMATTSVEAALTLDPAAPYKPTWSEKMLTLTFDGPLRFGTTYQVGVSTAATDTDGTHLAAPFAASFTTVAAGLSVVDTLPADGVSGSSVDGPIAVVFDRPIDPTTVKDALTIVPPVAGTTSVAAMQSDAARPPLPSPSGIGGSDATAGGSILLFTPAAPLGAHTTYTVTLAPVVAPVGGAGQVSAGQTWTFTTGQSSASAENQIAFLSGRAGVTDVWLMNPDGTNPRQVTTSLAPVVGFDVTVDGQRLVYSAAGVVSATRIDGTDARTVTGADRFEYAPTLTPDGDAVLVGRRGADGSDQGYWLEPLPGSGSGSERQVLPDGAPSIGSSETADPAAAIDAPWSGRAAFDPTGRLVLVAGGDASLRLVDLGSGDPQVVRLPLAAATAPVWSTPDDAFLVAATSQSDTTAAIWRISPTGRTTMLAAGVGPVATDGMHAFAFLEDQGGGSGTALHVAYVGHPGADPVPLTTAGDRSDRTPVFAPDGGQVLFVGVAATNPTVSTGIWVVATDGSDLRQLTRDGTQPRWLP
ncbi:MAG: Ig-like domain-containing protein [Candidatus Limnocylindrales bacterium]